MSTAVQPEFHTSGLVRLTRPQLLGTMLGLVLSVLLAVARSNDGGDGRAADHRAALRF
jgi:hypothetical protein